MIATKATFIERWSNKQVVNSSKGGHIGSVNIRLKTQRGIRSSTWIYKQSRTFKNLTDMGEEKREINSQRVGNQGSCQIAP